MNLKFRWIVFNFQEGEILEIEIEYEELLTTEELMRIILYILFD